MAWISVDKNGTEKIFNKEPKRSYNNGNEQWVQVKNTHRIVIPKGSVERLLGRELRWTDAPVEI